MDTLLRMLAEWKAKGKAAQVIVFDGGAEVDTSRAFLRGVVLGIVASTVIFVITAPGRADPNLVAELERRESMVRESNLRLTQAVSIADVCLSTAKQLEETLASYQAFLSGRPLPAGPAARAP